MHARRPNGALILEFLGSMNLAITLLVALAIASIIGTVLQQNQPYQDYIIKFGPFWFEIFKTLGLYDVYAAPWFLALLGFLLASTTVCVYRNTPAILKDMSHFRVDAQEKSLRGFKHMAVWHSAQPPERVREQAAAYLHSRGYRFRLKQDGERQVIAAMKGATGRLGYILSHLGIVVICLGGLVDGNLPLKLDEAMGRIAIETRDIPVDQVPEKSWLPADNSAFRGSVNIPEGGSANFIFLGMRDGYLVQHLPFSIELKDFRIEHYPSGMPKSFESDVVIHDQALDQPLERTIAVNHPLVYKGYAIYQSSFSDGGSGVTFAAWPLGGTEDSALPLHGTISSSLKLATPRGPYRVELDDFKLFNIFPVEEGDTSGKKFHNYGPSVIFKLRAASGEAREYVNYLAPIMVKGRPFFLSGMRTTTAEDYRYLHIPVDDKGGIERFMRFRAMVMDAPRLLEAVRGQIAMSPSASAKDEAARADIEKSITSLVNQFLREGIDTVVSQAEASVGPEQRDAALESLLQVIQGVLGSIYVDMLSEEGVDVQAGISDTDARFFDDAVNALSLLGPYGSPVYMQLKSFNHVQASGLQITKSPGQNIVYLGCVMLMAGVFFMFYLHHRRLWLQVRTDGEVLLAAAGHRDRADFDKEFAQLRTELERATGAVTP